MAYSSTQLKKSIITLYEQAATLLPPSVENALYTAFSQEGKASRAHSIGHYLIKNIEIAKTKKVPICQDTGIPLFYIEKPLFFPESLLHAIIIQATREATYLIPLRPNAVDPLTGKNTNDNTGIGIPSLYMCNNEQSPHLKISLLLKGGGSENIGCQYALPYSLLNAERTHEGIERVILHAVYQAQGKGCPPYFISVGIAGTRDGASLLSKKQFFRALGQRHHNETIAHMEQTILKKINQLGIGPGGYGGNTTALELFIDTQHRHPATFFVDVAFFCWAYRRASVLIPAKKEMIDECQKTEHILDYYDFDRCLFGE